MKNVMSQSILKRVLGFLLVFVLLLSDVVIVFAAEETTALILSDECAAGEYDFPQSMEENAAGKTDGMMEADGDIIDSTGTAFDVSAEDMVSKANSYIGRANYDIGINTDWGWCVMFARKCAEEIGLYLSDSNVVTTFCNQAIQKDYAHFYGIEPYAMNTGKNYTAVSRKDFRPEPGDLVCFLWTWNDDGWYDHIGIVTEVSGSTMTYVDGNSDSTDSNGNEIVDWHCKNWTSDTDIKGYLRPNYSNKPRGREPEGRLDAAEGLEGKLHITGWAFDPDMPGESLKIHVYVGGPAGDRNAQGYAADLNANLSSPDVNQAFGISGKHRFDITLDTWKRGMQPVYVYAIDIGNIPADNRHINNSPLNINIRDTSFNVEYNKPFDLKNGETKTFNFTFQGDNIYTVGAEIGNRSIATGTLKAPEWGKNPVPASIELKGLAPGKTVFTYKLLDKNNKVLYSKSNDINVIQPVTGITLNKTNTVLQVGEKETLIASVAPKDATNKSVSWKSSDTGVATVNSSGKITAIAPGTAVITATTSNYYSAGYKATCKVKVLPSMTGITLNKKEMTLRVGESETLTTKVSPEGAGEVSLIWTSGDKNIFTVEKGVIKAVSPGTAKAAVRIRDTDYTDRCTVTVLPLPTGITLNKKEMTLRVGESETLTTKVSPEGAGEVSLIWASGDKNIFTVEKGVIKAVSPGTAKAAVRIRDTDYTDRCTVTVVAAEEENDIPGENKPVENEPGENEPGENEPGKNNPGENLPGTDESVYYEVKFYIGNELLHKEAVEQGKNLIMVPTVSEEEKEFAGWYDMETGKLWDQTMPIMKALSLRAGFVESSTENEKPAFGLDPALIIRDNNIFMVKGQNYVLPAAILGNEIVWKSSDPKTVKIISKNKVKALKATDGRKIRLFNGTTPYDSTICYMVQVADPYIALVENGTQEKVRKTVTMVSGDIRQLVLAGMNDTNLQNEVFWESSNDETAKVDNGKVTALKSGTAQITAYFNGKAYRVSIRVKEINAISKIESAIILKPLQVISIRFADGFQIRNAVWTSDHDMLTEMNPAGTKVLYYQDSVVRITPSGKLTAAGVGTTNITAATPDGRKKTFSVTVQSPVNTITYLNVGETRLLKYYNVKASKAAWQVTGENGVIENKGNGKIKGLKYGKTELICNYDPFETGGFTYRSTIYTEDPKIIVEAGDSMSIRNAAQTSGMINLNQGDEYKIKVNGLFRPVIFFSNNNAAAFVDEAGVIHARKAGKAAAVCKVNRKRINITVNVK